MPEENKHLIIDMDDHIVTPDWVSGHKKVIIDDNTLFILLAVRYQGSFYIPNVRAFYDDDTNYKDTIATVVCNSSDIQDIVKWALKWMEKNAEVEVMRVGETVTITSKAPQKLKERLYDYLSEFTVSGDYFDKNIHKKALYDFINTIESNISQFKGRFSTDSFSQNQQHRNRYKMVEYIAWLIQEEFLELYDDEPFGSVDGFSLNDGKEGLKKLIQIRFLENKADDLFVDYYEEAKRQHVLRELEQRGFQESPAFKLFKNRKVIYKGLSEKEDILDRRLYQLFEYCMKEDVASISLKDYREKVNGEVMEDNSIRKLFSRLNKVLEDKLGINFKILTSIGDSEW